MLLLLLLFLEFENNENSIILDNEDFGYSQITVHRPQRDEDGNIIKDAKGKPKSDNALKDKENIPLKDDIDDFFAKEVTPFVPDAWYKKSETKIGYEINFAKYFFQHKAPRSLEEISADIFKIEEETEHLLKEIVEA